MISDSAFIRCRQGGNPNISEICYFEHFILVLVAEFLKFLEFLIFEFNLGDLLYDFKCCPVAHKRNDLISEILDGISFRI